MIAGQIEIQMLADLARLKRDMDEAKNVVVGTTDRMNRAFDVMRNVLATIGAAALLRELAEMTDRFKSLEGRMVLATGSAEAATEQIDKLTAAANRQQVPLEEVLKLYLGAQRSANDLGASQSQLTKFTEGVSAGLRLSGSSAQAASGSLGQLTQLLGGTNVQAQEFNSLIDGMPEVLRTVAANLGTTGISMGELRQRVIEGKLSSQDFFQAFLKGSDDLIKKAATLPPTVGGAFTTLSNNALLAVGRIDKELGASSSFARGVKFLGDSVPLLIEPVLQLTRAIEPAIKIAAAYFAIFVAAPAVIAALVTAKVAATAALVSFTATASLVGAPIAAFSLLMGGATTASFALAGSIGVLQASLGVLFAAFAGFQIGSYLQENFRFAALAGIAFVERTLLGWEAVKYGAQVAWAYIANAWELSLSGMGGVLSGFLRNMAGGLSSLGLDSAAEKVLGWATRITDATRSTGDLDARLAALRGEYDRGTAAVRSITGAMADDTIAKFNNARQTAATTAEVTKIVTATGNKAEADKRAAAAAKEAAAEAEKQDSAYLKLRTSILDKTGAMTAEDQAGQKLTSGQQFALQVMQNIQDGTLRLTDARKREITALLENLLATEELTEANKRHEAWMRESGASNERFRDSVRGASDSLRDQVEKQREANQQASLSKEALAALSIQKDLDRAATLERNATIMDEIDADLAAEWRGQAAALRELAGLKADGVHVQAAKDADEAWKRTSQSISQGLTDSLFRAFESGKDFFSVLWDGVKNTVKTTILKPLIEDISKPFLSFFSNVVNDVASTILRPQIATDGINGFLSTLWNGLTSIVSGFSSSMGGVMSGIGSAVGGLFGGGVSGAAGSAAGGGLSGLAGAAIGGLGNLGAGLAAGWSQSMAGVGLSASLGNAAAVGGATGTGIGIGAIAPWALGIGAALAIANKLFGGGGGPKTSGLANTAGAAGLRGGAVQSGSQDGAAGTILATLESAYKTFTGALGGQAGSLTGTVFFAQDPKGKAATQLIYDAAINGQNVFSRNNNLQTGANIEDVGRSNDAFAAALAEAQTRALLASLKATTFSDAAIASQVAAINSNASAQQIESNLQAILADKQRRDQEAAAAQQAQNPPPWAGTGGAIGVTAQVSTEVLDLYSRTAVATEKTAVSARETHGWLAHIGPLVEALRGSSERTVTAVYESSQFLGDRLRGPIYEVNSNIDLTRNVLYELIDTLKAEMQQLRVQIYNSEQTLLIPAKESADYLQRATRGGQPQIYTAAAA